MTLENFLRSYGGGACLTIDGYCEEAFFHYWLDISDCGISDYNIIKTPWWDEVRNRKVEFWNIIGGDASYPVELIIELED